MVDQLQVEEASQASMSLHTYTRTYVLNGTGPTCGQQGGGWENRAHMQTASPVAGMEGDTLHPPSSPRGSPSSWDSPPSFTS